jgi:hypothetical protein
VRREEEVAVRVEVMEKKRIGESAATSVWL